MTRNHIPSGAQVRVLQASVVFFLLCLCPGGAIFGLVADLVVEEICPNLAFFTPTTPHQHHPNLPNVGTQKDARVGREKKSFFIISHSVHCTPRDPRKRQNPVSSPMDFEGWPA
jgi:hypothetical protein